MITELPRQATDLRAQNRAEAELVVSYQGLAERIDVKSYNFVDAAFESAGIAELLQKALRVALGYSHAHACLGRKMIVYAGRLDAHGLGHIARTESIEAPAADHGFGNVQYLVAFRNRFHQGESLLTYLSIDSS